MPERLFVLIQIVNRIEDNKCADSRDEKREQETESIDVCREVDSEGRHPRNRLGHDVPCTRDRNESGEVGDEHDRNDQDEPACMNLFHSAEQKRDEWCRKKRQQNS